MSGLFIYIYSKGMIITSFLFLGKAHFIHSSSKRTSQLVQLVRYLTQVSDLDLAPDPEQFVASPPVRYINSGCCVNFFQKSAMANNIFCIMMMAIFVCWKIYYVPLDTLQRCPGVVKIYYRGGGARNLKTRAPTKMR